MDVVEVHLHLDLHTAEHDGAATADHSGGVLIASATVLLVHSPCTVPVG